MANTPPPNFLLIAADSPLDRMRSAKFAIAGNYGHVKSAGTSIICKVKDVAY